jgi:Protein of unknown function (DUF1488)
MTLNFPNPTRSFDEKRNAVGFVGHVGVFEIRFFVEASALGGDASPAGEVAEATCLSTFDRLRANIHDAARQAYSHKRLSSYTLSAADLR